MSYPIERRAGEIERLHVQAAAMAPDCALMLDRMGVNAGWRCLDLGCGPGGITALLSERVGETGHVVGLDADAVFLDHARRNAAPHVEFVTGDAYRTGLPGQSFDLAWADGSSTGFRITATIPNAELAQITLSPY